MIFLGSALPLLLAFAAGFYILLHEVPQENEKERYVFFDDLKLAMVKTLTMLPGELEFSNSAFMHLYNTNTFMFLMAFVLLIVIVLMNLLNALVVEQVIKFFAEEGDISMSIGQFELISDLVSTHRITRYF